MENNNFREGSPDSREEREQERSPSPSRSSRFNRGRSPSPSRNLEGQNEENGNQKPLSRSPSPPPATRAEPARGIGVFGLSGRTKQRDLEDEFRNFGEIEKVNLILDRRTGLSKRYGFVYFKNIDDAIKAQSKMNGKMWMDSKIRVDFAFPESLHSRPFSHRGNFGSHRGSNSYYDRPPPRYSYRNRTSDFHHGPPREEFPESRGSSYYESRYGSYRNGGGGYHHAPSSRDYSPRDHHGDYERKWDERSGRDYERPRYEDRAPPRYEDHPPRRRWDGPPSRYEDHPRGDYHY